MRTKDDAIATARMRDPITLNRLLKTDEQLKVSIEEASVRSGRRDALITELVNAGVTYTDLGRILDMSSERVRQLVARHLGVNVNQLNPRNTTPQTSRH